MYLIINAIDQNVSLLLLNSESFKVVKRKKIDLENNLSEQLLLNIDQLVEGNLSQIKGIFVNLGPGSYTSLRIEIATANSIAFSLNIPIMGFKKEVFDNEESFMAEIKKTVVPDKFVNFVVPIYSGDPHITKPKGFA